MKRFVSLKIRRNSSLLFGSLVGYLHIKRAVTRPLRDSPFYDSQLFFVLGSPVIECLFQGLLLFRRQALPADSILNVLGIHMSR